MDDAGIGFREGDPTVHPGAIQDSSDALALPLGRFAVCPGARNRDREGQSQTASKQADTGSSTHSATLSAGWRLRRGSCAPVRCPAAASRPSPSKRNRHPQSRSTFLSMDDETSEPFVFRKPDESQDAAGERISDELSQAADVQQSRAGEEAERPPLRCDQCGEPIFPGDDYKAVTKADPETDEPLGFTGKVVHSGCWENWAEAHDVEPESDDSA